MPKLMGCLTCLLALHLLLPAASDGQDKQDKKGAAKQDKVTKEDATLQDYTNLAQTKEVVGKIAALDVQGGTMTLTIEWSHMEPNKNAAGKANPNQKLQQLENRILHEYEQAMRTKNPVQRQQALSKLQA